MSLVMKDADGNPVELCFVAKCSETKHLEYLRQLFGAVGAMEFVQAQGQRRGRHGRLKRMNYEKLATRLRRCGRRYDAKSGRLILLVQHAAKLKFEQSGVIGVLIKQIHRGETSYHGYFGGLHDFCG